MTAAMMPQPGVTFGRHAVPPWTSSWEVRRRAVGVGPAPAGAQPPRAPAGVGPPLAKIKEPAKPLKIWPFFWGGLRAGQASEAEEQGLNAWKIRVFVFGWHGLCYCTDASGNGLRNLNLNTMER
jgi:hypothetical protein